MTTAFVSTTVPRNDAPDIVFDGRMIASIASEARDDAWIELSLYEMDDASWLAVRKDCSSAAASDTGEVVHIPAERPSNMQIKAMGLWRWSWLAKDLARTAGWDVRERVGRAARLAA